MRKTISDDEAIGRRIPPCASGCDFLAESDHRTANQFALLASYIQMKAAELERTIEPTPAAVRLFVRSILIQVQSTARLNRLLSDHGPHASVGLSQLLHEVCAPFAAMYADRIALVEDFAADCVVRAGQSVPICQIVVEAIINSVKHARTDEGQVAIWVRCRATEAGAWVEVSDNGRGGPEASAAELGHGLGLRLMRAHARASGGAISFENTHCGFKVELEVPLEHMPAGLTAAACAASLQTGCPSWTGF